MIVFMRLSGWYNSISKRQRIIMRITIVALCLIPIVGWLFIAPWLAPLFWFLEWNFKPADSEKATSKN